MDVSSGGQPHAVAKKTPWIGEINRSEVREIKRESGGVQCNKAAIQGDPRCSYLVGTRASVAREVDSGARRRSALRGAQGLIHLAGLPRLEVLDLANTQVDDAGVVHLA